MSTVEDGEGTSSALKISTSGVEVDGTLNVTGNVTGVPHIDYRGNYSGSTAYVKDDVVFYNGSSYIAKQSSTGNAPTNTTYWGLLAQKGTDGSDGTNGTGTNGLDGTDGTDGTDGLGFTGGSYDSATGQVTFTSDDGLGFSTGDIRGSSANLTYSANADGAGHLANSVGSTTDGLIITNRQPTLQIVLNSSTGSTDSSTKADYKLQGLRTRITRSFANVQTAEDYLFKYHNGHHGIVDFRFETDITDATFTPKMDQRYCGKYFIGEGGTPKWTITSLGSLPVCQIRGQLYIQDLHVCVNGNPSNVSNLFEVFEGGYTLLNNGVAIEFGTDVIFSGAIFYNSASTFYNEANPLEIKNNLTNPLYFQPLHNIAGGGLAYVRNEVLFSGQFNVARFVLGGGTFQFVHAYQYAGTQASDRGPFIMESNYSLPSGYISNNPPAFIFEQANSMVLHDNDPVSQDVMRYTTLLGCRERFDRHTLSGNIGSHNGVDPFERNFIIYSHGNNGEAPTQVNYRGWVFWGVTPSTDLPAKKAFQII